MPGLPVHHHSQSPPKPMSIESVMPSNKLILCHPLLLLPSIFPNIRVFASESVLCIRWPKYWSFSFNISPSNEHPGLISFRMDWLDLLAVQGTLKSLLHSQHHSSKTSILQHSASFIVQLSALAESLLFNLIWETYHLSREIQPSHIYHNSIFVAAFVIIYFHYVFLFIFFYFWLLLNWSISWVKISQSCPTLATPWTLQSMEFSWSEYWRR